ncbi:hypothetical protein LJC72_03605 [Bacteroides sp. OttesenSCG-928-D19]|nr:hypothetical protein [Bacteroides sp. OttesenSCG-928-D19]
MGRKTELTNKERFCLDAYLINNDVDTAYLLSRDRPSKSATQAIVHVQALRWVGLPLCKEYLTERRTLLRQKQEKESPREETRTKTDVIRELNRIADTAKTPKEQIDALMKIAELERMKQDESKDEKKTVHYYLPLTCDKCQLFNEHKKKGNKR